MYAGVRYLLETGPGEVVRHDRNLTALLGSGLRKIPGVHVFSGKEESGPILSFTIEGMNPSDSAYILSSGYGITVRSGLQCAPLIHEKLGPLPYGTIRLSCSWFTAEQECVRLIEAERDCGGRLVRLGYYDGETGG